MEIAMVLNHLWQGVTEIKDIISNINEQIKTADKTSNIKLALVEALKVE
jgi:hypothetical protein